MMRLFTGMHGNTEILVRVDDGSVASLAFRFPGDRTWRQPTFLDEVTSENEPS
jgi:hypothetical protein